MIRSSLPTLITGLSVLCASSPGSAAEAPIALEKWGRYHVNITAYMPNIAPGAKVKWVPKVSLVFKVTAPETDDVIELQHYQGASKWGPVQKCQIEASKIIPRRGKGGVVLDYSLVVPECMLDENLAISKTGTFSVEVSYKQTGRGKVHEKLGRYTYQVKQHNGVWPGKKGPTQLYHVDHDFRIGEAWFYLNSEGKAEIWTWFKYDREGEADVRGARLRCFVGDKKMPFFDNPTGRTTNDIDSYPQRNINKKITWGLWYWWAPRVEGMMTDEWMQKNPGKYHCTLTQKGDIAREFSFEVGADGQVLPAPCQTVSGPDQVKTLENEQLIQMQMKKGQDLKYDQAAFKKSGLYGRKWPKGCPL